MAVNDLFWLILAIPLLWPFAAKVIFHTSITWAEMALNVVIALVLAAGLWQAGRYGQAMDTEIWNGEVTGKDRVRVSCSHSYSCNCRMESSTGSDGKTVSRQVCDTCYEHPYDVDWKVRSNVGDFTINRVDRQGVVEPPRWTRVERGEPVAMAYRYLNWVKAAAHSLFHEEKGEAERFEGLIPDYPARIYDYHRLDRVLAVGVDLPDLKSWNADLSLLLKRLGPQREANIVLVIVKTPDPGYIHALQAAWQGAKKNDIVLAVGVTDPPRIAWARAFSWSKDPMLDILLRDEVESLGNLDREAVLGIVDRAAWDHFKRRPIEEFEYLKDEVDPPGWVVILTAILAFASSFGLTWVFHRVDIRFPFERRPAPQPLGPTPPPFP